MAKKSLRKRRYLENEKSFWDEIKSLFIIFKELSVKQITFFLEGESPTLKYCNYLSFTEAITAFLSYWTNKLLLEKQHTQWFSTHFKPMQNQPPISVLRKRRSANLLENNHADCFYQCSITSWKHQEPQAFWSSQNFNIWNIRLKWKTWSDHHVLEITTT